MYHFMYHANNDSRFTARIEHVDHHMFGETIEPQDYYRMHVSEDVTIFASADQLAEIARVCTEALARRTRNAQVAEPLRGIVNSISPEVTR